MELDGGYANGNAHLYMGVFETLVPPGMGGRPEIGRQHFEQALDISGGLNLMVKVMYADQYARLMFERKLHDQLLQDVLAAEVKAPGLTLMNTVAKERAQRLLDTADDYFNRLAQICVLMAGALDIADINSRDDAKDATLSPGEPLG